MNNINVISELGIFEILKYVSRKNKKLQAIILQAIEKYVDRTSPEYAEIRKIVLDSTSNFTRTVIRKIFGDIESFIE